MYTAVIHIGLYIEQHDCVLAQNEYFYQFIAVTLVVRFVVALYLLWIVSPDLQGDSDVGTVACRWPPVPSFPGACQSSARLSLVSLSSVI